MNQITKLDVLASAIGAGCLWGAIGFSAIGAIAVGLLVGTYYDIRRENNG